MTLDIDKSNIVNPNDDALRPFLNAEEALSRCIGMLRAEGIPDLTILNALIERIYSVVKPPKTGDADELRTFFERNIALMDDAVETIKGIRDILTEELADL